MKYFFIFSFFSLQTFAVQTVPFVDLNRYIGRWYEIASIPARFQRRCIKDVTAEYKILETGKVDVVNSCTQANGKRQVAYGLAEVKNHETNAELGVSFVPFLNHFGLFQGQYKILALGSAYEFSLVGEDKRNFGWILSRTPTLSLEILSLLEKEIRSQGYDSCAFLTSVQTGGDFETRRPLCEVVKN